MTHQPNIPKLFEQSLHQVIQSYQEHLSQSQLQQTIEQIAQLYGPPQPVSFQHIQDAPLTYKWSFRDAALLMEQMNNIFTVSAISVPAHHLMRPFDKVVVVLHTGQAPDVTLTGSIVHLGDTAAIQLEQLPPQAHHALHHSWQQLETMGPPPYTPPKIDVPAPPTRQTTVTRLKPLPPEPKPEPAPKPAPQIQQHTTQPATTRPKRTLQRMTLKHWPNNEQTFAQLLMQCAPQSGPHQLTITTKDHDEPHIILIDDADIIDITGPLVPRLDDWFMQRLRIPRSVLQHAQEIAQVFGMTLSEGLLDLHEIQYGALKQTLRSRLISTMEPLWLEEIMEATHEQLNHIPTRRLAEPINIYQQVYHHYDQVHQHNVHRVIEDEQTTCFQFVESLDLLNHMPLDHRQRGLLHALSDEMLTLFDAQAITTLPKQDTIHLLYVMRDMGLLIQRKNAVRSRQAERARSSLETRLRAAQELTDFELLGIHWSAHTREVEAAYAQQMQDLNTSEMATQPELVAELKLSYARAHHRLSTHKTRDAYRRTVVDDYAIRTAITLLYEQIEASKLKRDVERMIDCYEHILELNPHDTQAKRILDTLRHVQANPNQGK